MTPKDLYRLKAALFLAAAIIAPLVLMIKSKWDHSAMGFALVVGGVLMVISALHWIKHKKMPADAVIYDLSKQPLEEQLRTLKRGLWVMLAVGPLMSAWTYHDLSALEQGAERSVSVWVPVAMLYKQFGFWPAVLCWPLFSGSIAAFAYLRIEKIKLLVEMKNRQSVQNNVH